MAAGPWIYYNEGLEDILDGTVDLDSDTIVMKLCSATYTPAATDTAISNELSTANGYTNGGQTIAVTVTNAAGIITIDAADASWTASGAGIAAATAVIMKSGDTQPLFYSVLNSGSNITAAAGNDFDITIHANGVARVQAA